MDTKSKNKLKFSILFLLIFCIAAGTVSALISRTIVSSIEENMALGKDQTLTDIFSDAFNDNAYLFYYNMCLNADSSRSAEEIFFPDSYDYHDYNGGSLPGEIAQWQENFFGFMDRLSYYMCSSDEAEEAYQQTNLKSSEIIQATRDFMENGQAQTALDETYKAYFCLKYLDDGSIVFCNGKGDVGPQIFGTLQTLNNSDKMLFYYSGTQSTDSLNAPRNMEVFYAFPTLELQELGIYSGGTESYFGTYGGDILYFCLFLAALLFTAFLTIYCGNGGLMKTVFVTRAPEWSVAGFTLCIFLASPLFSLSGSLDLFNKYNTLIVAAAWAGNTLLIVWSSLLLMRLFRRALRQDLIWRSISVKLFKLLKKIWVRFADWLEKVFTRRARVLLPAIFIFLAAYAILNSREAGPLILLYLPILAILYYVIRRMTKKSLRGYDVLMRLTGRMAEGDLDVATDEIPQDLGVFESMKENTLQICDGLQKALEEERKSQNMRTELISNVSHDLRTPLTAIITYVDILKKADLPEDERSRCLEVLDTKSARLKTLIDDLFEVSKASSNSITMEPKEMDFVNFVRQYQVETEDRLADSGLNFRFDLPDKKLPVSLDGQRSYRIFENLADNAIKYSAPGSRVYVKVERSGKYAKFTMKNVSAAELNFDPDEITERFIRGDLSRNTEGSGLGLAIAKSFTELQDGSFQIEIDGDLFKAIILWPLVEGPGVQEPPE